MAITRTSWVDDDGSGTTGTVINNAEKTILYDQIDAAINAGGLSNWAAYTPTWFASVTPPAIGNGSLTGTFTTFGAFTYFELFLAMGSTTTYGAGTWNIGLPSGVILAAGYRGLIVLSGRAYNSTTAASVSIAGAVPLAPSGSTPNIEVYAGTLGTLGPTVPFTWAAGFQLQLSGVYRST